MQITTAASDNYTHYSERIVGKPSLTGIREGLPVTRPEYERAYQSQAGSERPTKLGFRCSLYLDVFRPGLRMGMSRPESFHKE